VIDNATWFTGGCSGDFDGMKTRLLAECRVYFDLRGRPEFEFVCRCGKRNDTGPEQVARCECGREWTFLAHAQCDEREDG
jgi:hypothetical protein